MESEDNLLKEALVSYIMENFKTAKVEFKKLVDIKPSEPSYLLYLGNCELKLKNYEPALDLYNKALKLSPSSSFNINYSKGIACFYLNKFVESRISFADCLKETKDPKQLGMVLPWMNKVEVELKESGVIDYNSADTKNLKVINNWIQNNETITVEITTNQNLNDYDIKLERKEITIQNKTNEKIKHTMTLTNAIVPEKSSFKISGMKAELTLTKEVPNFNWVNLEVQKEGPANVKSGGYYPSSSKVKKDWSVFDKEYDELSKEEKKTNGGNEGMWNLFRQIYERSDEQTRRAMVKSFQTSGGTVLSTNWDEVKDKDYEGKDRPEAPAGQEWAKNE